jgi:hypothetical protein
VHHRNEHVEGFNRTKMRDQSEWALIQEKDHRVVIRDLLEQELKGEAGISIF